MAYGFFLGFYDLLEEYLLRVIDESKVIGIFLEYFKHHKWKVEESFITFYFFRTFFGFLIRRQKHESVGYPKQHSIQ